MLCLCAWCDFFSSYIIVFSFGMCKDTYLGDVEVMLEGYLRDFYAESTSCDKPCVQMVPNFMLKSFLGFFCCCCFVHASRIYLYHPQDEKFIDERWGRGAEGGSWFVCFSCPEAKRASTVLLGADRWSDRRYAVGTKLPLSSHRDNRSLSPDANGRAGTKTTSSV